MLPLKYTYIDGIDIELTDDDVQAICQSGANAAAVHLVTAQSYVIAQFKGYSTKHLIDTAIEYGCNDYGSDGKPTALEARQFIVWCAAWNIHDDQCEVAE